MSFRRTHKVLALIAFTLTQPGCRTTDEADHSTAKDFDQVRSMTQDSATCFDGTVWRIQSLGNQMYRVQSPSGNQTEVTQSELLATVCPGPNGNQTNGLLRPGTYVSVKAEDGQKHRCDMSFVPKYDAAGKLVGANASATYLEVEDEDCSSDNINIYAFSCSGDGADLSCTATANSGGAIVIRNIASYSFEREYAGKKHTYGNIDAPTLPQGGTALLQSGIYHTNSQVCDVKIQAFYAGTKLSHIVAERTSAINSCNQPGRNIYACTDDVCVSRHGDKVRKIQNFVVNAFKFLSPTNETFTYGRITQ